MEEKCQTQPVGEVVEEDTEGSHADQYWLEEEAGLELELVEGSQAVQESEEVGLALIVGSHAVQELELVEAGLALVVASHAVQDSSEEVERLELVEAGLALVVGSHADQSWELDAAEELAPVGWMFVDV